MLIYEDRKEIFWYQLLSPDLTFVATLRSGFGNSVRHISRSGRNEPYLNIFAVNAISQRRCEKNNRI